MNDGAHRDHITATSVVSALSCLMAICTIGMLVSSCYGSMVPGDGGTSDQEDILADALEDAVCVHSHCDILPQCGCPVGYMCTLTREGTRVCAITGLRDEGHACSEFECAPGLLCDAGVCRRACHDDIDCTQSHDCFHDIVGESIRMCDLFCDILTGDGCPEGYKCDFYRPEEGEGLYSDCFVPVSYGQQGDLCTHYWDLNHGSLDCAQGIACRYSFDFERGFCQAFCPASHADTLSPFCPEARPCCSEGTLGATSYGITYLSCGNLSSSCSD